jgi:hypothetical protein
VILTALKNIYHAQIPFNDKGYPGWKEEEERNNCMIFLLKEHQDPWYTPVILSTWEA